MIRKTYFKFMKKRCGYAGNQNQKNAIVKAGSERAESVLEFLKYGNDS